MHKTGFHKESKLMTQIDSGRRRSFGNQISNNEQQRKFQERNQPHFGSENRAIQVYCKI